MRKFDRYNYEFNTGLSRGAIETAKKYIADCESDPQRKDRKARARRCQACYYRKTISTCGFVRRNCDHCQNEYLHSNGDAGSLCPECSDALGLCRKCCGDIDMKIRRNAFN